MLEVIFLSVLTSGCLRGHLLRTMRNVNSCLNSAKISQQLLNLNLKRRQKSVARCFICRVQFENFQVVGMALPSYLAEEKSDFIENISRVYWQQEIMRGHQYMASHWMCVMRFKIYTWKSFPPFAHVSAPRGLHSHFFLVVMLQVTPKGLSERGTTRNPFTI